MGHIPEDVIAEIRARADIVAVVGQYVQLKKAGRNHKGVCPFHADRTPSFNVSPDKGFFFCFGCHKKGDVFTFLMEYDGKSFGEALETLAALTGVELPARGPGGPAGQSSPRAEMLRINAVATDYFCAQLASDAGATARAYLDSRGISLETRAAFRLGHAPAGWSGLADHFAQKQVAMATADALGLVAARQRGQGWYDRFRDRLVCPIMTVAGEVSGFSARRIAEPAPDEDPPPKYINSPESAVYKKSKLLFGLHQARTAIRDNERAILVEGNFDVVAMHQAGFRETVAPLGTALTDEQGDLLRRLSGRVVLFYDGDNAGRAATRKAIKTLVAMEIEVLVTEIPLGEDPDSLLRKQGAEAVADLIARARPGIEYYLDLVWGEAAQSVDGKTRALKEAADVLLCITDATKRDLAVGTFAHALGVSEENLRRGLRRALTKKNAPAARAATEQMPSTPRPAKSAPPPEQELTAIALLADHPQLMPLAEELNLLSYLTDYRLRDMYSAAQKGAPLLSALPDEPAIASRVFAGAFIAIPHPANTLRDIASVLAKNLALARLKTSPRSHEPDQERLRLLDIWNTRRQVD